MFRLDTHRDSTQLAAELAERAPPSQVSQLAFLRRLERLLPLAGISRVADISHLSPSGLPVQQATRPDIYSHIAYGQNTGAQGRGATRAVARIGAILEALEVYSAEPRNAHLIRGTYDFLRHGHAIMCPSRFASGTRAPAPSQAEPLVWTTIFSLEKRIELLTPAEGVFAPFFPAEYATRSFIPWNSTGLGAGPTRTYAVLHGLYEVIERHFRAILQDAPATLRVERITRTSLRHLPELERLTSAHPELTPCLLSVEPPGVQRGVFMMICALFDAERIYVGYGCNSQPGLAIQHAVSEAAQGVSVSFSAAREDQSLRRRRARPPKRRSSLAQDLPPETLPLERLLRRGRKPLASLRAELELVADWVHRLGFRDILIKDLTRVGLEVPVVRVIVPGARHPWPDSTSSGNTTTERDIRNRRFSMDPLC